MHASQRSPSGVYQSSPLVAFGEVGKPGNIPYTVVRGTRKRVYIFAVFGCPPFSAASFSVAGHLRMYAHANSIYNLGSGQGYGLLPIMKSQISTSCGTGTPTDRNVTRSHGHTNIFIFLRHESACLWQSRVVVPVCIIYMRTRRVVCPRIIHAKILPVSRVYLQLTVVLHGKIPKW